MKTNLAQLEQAEMDKVNVDLAAAGVAFKERYNMPVVAEVVEREQPEHLRAWVSRAADCPSSGFRITIPTPLRTQS
ncbi:DNA polymerase III subunit theta [Salmonella enterica subsp. enterica]|nr:DNA polymerase III subunit theta [Salmonella enterica subsp. enterica]